VHVEGARQCLGSLGAQLDAVVLGGGDRRLGDPGAFGQLVLTEFVELS
jgi:hypothetical protein